MPLYHYTCDHSRAAITDLLLPSRDLVDPGHPNADLASPFVWLTDLTVPIPQALGLTMTAIACDRTVHRYRVTNPSDCNHWLDVRKMLPSHYVELLEAAPGVRPAHWWISTSPVPVVYDPVRVTA